MYRILHMCISTGVWWNVWEYNETESLLELPKVIHKTQTEQDRKFQVVEVLVCL